MAEDAKNSAAAANGQIRMIAPPILSLQEGYAAPVRGPWQYPYRSRSAVIVDEKMIAFVNRLADASGAVIRPYFRQRIEVTHKPGVHAY